MFSCRSLSWFDHDGWRRGLQSLEQLEQSWPAGTCASRWSSFLVQRDLEIDNRNMDWFSVDDPGSFITGFRLHGSNAHGRQEAGQLQNGRHVSPASIGQKQIEPRSSGSLTKVCCRVKSVMTCGHDPVSTPVHRRGPPITRQWPCLGKGLPKGLGGLGIQDAGFKRCHLPMQEGQYPAILAGDALLSSREVGILRGYPGHFSSKDSHP